METIVRRSVEPTAAVTELLAAANAAGGRDNATAILAARPMFGSTALPSARPSGDTAELIPTGDPQRSSRSSGSEQAAKTGSAPGFFGRLLIVALMLAAIGAAVAWQAGMIFSPPGRTEPPVTTGAAPRVLRVSYAPGAGFTSIADALSAAQAGDVIDVDAGTYREAIVLKEGVSVRARERRTVVLEPPAALSGPWTAISATSLRDGDISGFVIKGTDQARLEYGVWVSNASVELDDLDIAGARTAGIQVTGASTVRLRSSDIHDSAGAGVVVDAGAVAEILHNVIADNGRVTPPRPGIELRTGARGTIIGNLVRANGQAIAGAPPAELARLRSQNAIENPPAAPARGSHGTP
jgi:hypothetical protein